MTGESTNDRAGRAAIWLPGLAVAVGAAVATAHGLFEVATAARVPVGVAWLYPLITDGLALVAYAATARLSGSAARYAWSVVVLAAGLSGLAQAAFLAADTTGVEAPAVLRFGVGAWPAVAAAIVAHLLFLLATSGRTAELPTAVAPPSPSFSPPAVQPAPTVQPSVDADPRSPRALPGRSTAPRAATPRSGPSPARDRARAAAARHARHHGALPTVSELETVAEVSRGTAHAVLKDLRDQHPPLHVIATSTTDEPDPRQENVQP